MADHRPAERIELPARGWRIDPRHALIAAGICWLGFAATCWVVLSGRGADFDAAGLSLWRTGADLHPAGPPWLVEAMRDVTALGGVLIRQLITIAAIIALIVMRLRREAILLAGTIATGWLVNSLLKGLVGRPRPQIVPHLTDAGGLSFPSGHSFNAAVVFIAIALAFAALSARRSVRWTLIGCAMVLSLTVALTRVWLGVHFPTDAIAGWLGGAAWAFTAAALLYRPAKAAAEATDKI